MSRNFASVSKRKLVLLQTSAWIYYLKWYHQIFPVSFITPAGRSRRLCSLTRRLTTIESISSFCFFFLLLIQTGRRRYYAWAIQREFLFVFHTKWGFFYVMFVGANEWKRKGGELLDPTRRKRPLGGGKNWNKGERTRDSTAGGVCKT